MVRSVNHDSFNTDLYLCYNMIRIYVQRYIAAWARQRSRYSDWLLAGRSGDRIPVGARFSKPVQTGSGAHPPSWTMGTGSFPGGKYRPGVTLTPHPLLVPWSRKGRAISPLPLWAVRPVQSLSACTGVYLCILTINPTPFMRRDGGEN